MGKETPKIIVILILVIVLLIGLALIPRFFLLHSECSNDPSPFCWKDRCCPDVIDSSGSDDPGVYPYCKLESIILPSSSTDLGCQIDPNNTYATCPDEWHYDCCICNQTTCDAPMGYECATEARF